MAPRTSRIGLLLGAFSLLACSSGGPDGNGNNGNGNGNGNNPGDGGVSTPPGSDSGSAQSSDSAADTGADAPAVSDGGQNTLAKGWLYTKGNKVMVADGNGGGAVWVGRGFNIDDIFFCGYNNSLWMNNAEQNMKTLVSTAITGWKPTFLRFNLSMNSFQKVSWLQSPAQYKTPMTNVITSVGQSAGVYALVTLRSDTTMTCADDATCVPTNATDAVYTALVDTFANASYVLFGLSNEPGGNAVPIGTLAQRMDHAVSVIRAEENKLGVPHHVVSVQGYQWTSDISYYAKNPLPYDNVVYEVHGYPPLPSSYTYANIPVILGEYGTLSNAQAFFNDIEQKQIPNLAWDLQPYSNCAPDLVNVNQSSSNLVPSAWGNTVKAYLAAH